jgi:ABC-type cobalamin/Fe3+-siderophores transport system ATPase subunit
MNLDIEIHDATVSYREHIALKNISLSIETGSFTAVVGPNGAGKTTLLTLINGLGRLQNGTVKIFNKPVKSMYWSRVRKEIGYVPQHLDIDERMPISVYDTILLGRYGKIGLFRYPGKKDHATVDRISKLVGVEHLLKKPIGHLSGGEMQKVSIARALVQEPKILLLDEPTANLDIRAEHEVMYLIEHIYRTEKLTIVFVTHLLDHLPGSCTAAILLKNGHIVAAGKTEDVFTEEQLTAVYDYRVKLPIRSSRG